MRSMFLLLAATVLAGCSMMPFGGDDAEKPSAAVAPNTSPMAVVSASSSSTADRFEIQDADRGPVQRVKVLLNGRTIDTLVMRYGREATTHCCTADGCQKIEPAKACTTFKMTCDTNGVCMRVSIKDSSKI
jgi:hypothetical protein